MNYTFSHDFSGNFSDFKETAKQYFLSKSFIRNKSTETDSLIEFSNSRKLNSTKEDPIYGLSEITFNSLEGKVEISYSLNNTKFLVNFTRYFPLSLTSFLMFIFFMSGQLDGRLSFILMSIAPWLVISPLMGKYIIKRSKSAVEELLKVIISQCNS